MMRKKLAEGDVRTVLRFHPVLAPVKIAVLPLSKKLGEEHTKFMRFMQKLCMRIR